MKKFVAFLLMAAMVFTFTTALADDFNFDISVFENNSAFTVEFDDMNDTGEIKLTDGGLFIGVNDDGNFSGGGEINIKILESFPPCLRLCFVYCVDDWYYIDKLILKTNSTRYTFEVDEDTDVEDGKVYGFFTVVLTPDNISLLKEISDGNTIIDFRMDGDKDIDGQLIFSAEECKLIYDAYVESGALDNNFYIIETLYPCTIKDLSE